jgi:hypothetical protein
MIAAQRPGCAFLRRWLSQADTPWPVLRRNWQMAGSAPTAREAWEISRSALEEGASGLARIAAFEAAARSAGLGNEGGGLGGEGGEPGGEGGGTGGEGSGAGVPTADWLDEFAIRRQLWALDALATDLDRARRFQPRAPRPDLRQHGAWGHALGPVALESLAPVRRRLTGQHFPGASLGTADRPANVLAASSTALDVLLDLAWRAHLGSVEIPCVFAQTAEGSVEVAKVSAYRNAAGEATVDVFGAPTTPEFRAAVRRAWLAAWDCAGAGAGADPGARSRDGMPLGRIPDLILWLPGGTRPIVGASLGLAVAAAALALARGRELPPDLAYTGEVATSGEVRSVGGIPLKVGALEALAAYREFALPPGDAPLLASAKIAAVEIASVAVLGGVLDARWKAQGDGLGEEALLARTDDLLARGLPGPAARRLVGRESSAGTDPPADPATCLAAARIAFAVCDFDLARIFLDRFGLSGSPATFLWPGAGLLQAALAVGAGDFVGALGARTLAG